MLYQNKPVIFQNMNLGHEYFTHMYTFLSANAKFVETILLHENTKTKHSTTAEHLSTLIFTSSLKTKNERKENHARKLTKK